MMYNILVGCLSQGKAIRESEDRGDRKVQRPTSFTFVLMAKSGDAIGRPNYSSTMRTLFLICSVLVLVSSATSQDKVMGNLQPLCTNNLSLKGDVNGDGNVNVSDVATLINIILGINNSSTPTVKTLVFDSNTQPIIVGGYINGYSPKIVRKGIIVSDNIDDMFIDSNTSFVDYNEWQTQSYLEMQTPRFVDCTSTNEEEFLHPLKWLNGNSDYYVKAFAITSDNEVLYGDIKAIHTGDFSRYPGKYDRANVFHAFDYTLFDLVTDEAINPNDGFYYSSNENPTTVRHQVGTNYNTCYKFATEWNYKLWYYHNIIHCDQDKIVHMPRMRYVDGKLEISKSLLDYDKNVTIHYSINANGSRPESFSQTYSDPLELSDNSTVYCYAISDEGYISFTNMYTLCGITSLKGDVNGDGRVNVSDVATLINIILGISDNSLLTINTVVLDSNSQPMYAGGFINNYKPDSIKKKGIIVSTNKDGIVITDQTQYELASILAYTTGFDYDYAMDYRVYDCTGINEEEFICPLLFMKGDTDYYLKAFAITRDDTILYGNVEKVHTPSFNRYDGRAGIANVFHAFEYTLFDIITDEIIDPSKGFYYSTNENPTTVGHQIGTSSNTCFKLASLWNYKLWYYHNVFYCDSEKVVTIPTMKLINDKLEITKSSADLNKDITIYYSIGGDASKPEEFIKYTSPLNVEKGAIIYCYAISSDGYISYTNRYKVY